MTYNWCHGPSCHTTETQSRVRGSKGNKVLRTIKIKPNRYGNYQSGIWNHFCNQRCLMDYMQTHIQSCLLYTSPSPRDRTRSRMPSSA